MFSLQASSTLILHSAKTVGLKALAASGANQIVVPSKSCNNRFSSNLSRVRTETSAGFHPSSLDVNKLFHEVDSDHDGHIGKSEFNVAMRLVQYDGILRTQVEAKKELDRLAKESATIERLERQVADIEARYGDVSSPYHSIGWGTGAEIDALFADSKLKRVSIKDTIDELKSLINDAKAAAATHP
jgi:hypothetical protein